MDPKPEKLTAPNLQNARPGTTTLGAASGADQGQRMSGFLKASDFSTGAAALAPDRHEAKGPGPKQKLPEARSTPLGDSRLELEREVDRDEVAQDEFKGKAPAKTSNEKPIPEIGVRNAGHSWLGTIALAQATLISNREGVGAMLESEYAKKPHGVVGRGMLETSRAAMLEDVSSYSRGANQAQGLSVIVSGRLSLIDVADKEYGALNEDLLAAKVPTLATTSGERDTPRALRAGTESLLTAASGEQTNDSHLDSRDFDVTDVDCQLALLDVAVKRAQAALHTEQKLALGARGKELGVEEARIAERTAVFGELEGLLNTLVSSVWTAKDLFKDAIGTGTEIAPAILGGALSPLVGDGMRAKLDSLRGRIEGVSVRARDEDENADRSSVAAELEGVSVQLATVGMSMAKSERSKAEHLMKMKSLGAGLDKASKARNADTPTNLEAVATRTAKLDIAQRTNVAAIAAVGAIAREALKAGNPVAEVVSRRTLTDRLGRYRDAARWIPPAYDSLSVGADRVRGELMRRHDVFSKSQPKDRT